MIKFNKQNNAIKGEIKVQGDRCISLFSILLSSIASGRSKLHGLLESKEVLNFIEIIKKLGITVLKDSNGLWIINGNGISGLKEPTNVIDILDSKDILYLLVGLLSSYNFKIFFKGDDSLINTDLEYMFNIFKSININFNGRNNKNLPFLMLGNSNKKQINFETENYNSILKNALLLSSLGTQKENKIIEKEKSTNHLEILMKYFGISFEEHDIGSMNNINIKIGKEIIISGNQNFSANDIIIPSDTTFSAFIAVLALMIPNSNITLSGVLMNQYRDAFYRTLIDMGADIIFVNQKIVCGEKICDINVKYSKLKDTTIPANRIYKIIDEFPSLILISCLTDAKIEIQGTKIIKNYNLSDYNQIIKIMKDLEVNFSDEADLLKINGKITASDKKIMVDKNITNPNIILMLGLFGLFIEHTVELNKDIEDHFPNLRCFLKCIGINVE